MNLKLISSILLLTFLLSCASTPEKKVRVSHFKTGMLYMPLNVGNSWKYNVSFLGKKGEIDIKITTSENGWFMDSRGGSFKIDERGIRDKDRYLLLFPLEENKEWTAILSPTQKEVRKIINVDQEIIVPAGKFEGTIAVEASIKVDKHNTLNLRQYFARNVGIVKIETFIQNIESGKVTPQTSQELTHFDIKK